MLKDPPPYRKLSSNTTLTMKLLCKVIARQSSFSSPFDFIGLGVYSSSSDEDSDGEKSEGVKSDVGSDWEPESALKVRKLPFCVKNRSNKLFVFRNEFVLKLLHLNKEPRKSKIDSSKLKQLSKNISRQSAKKLAIIRNVSIQISISRKNPKAVRLRVRKSMSKIIRFLAHLVSSMICYCAATRAIVCNNHF